MAFYSGPLLFNLLILIVPWYYFARSAIARSNFQLLQLSISDSIDFGFEVTISLVHVLSQPTNRWMLSQVQVRAIVDVYLSGACTVNNH